MSSKVGPAVLSGIGAGELAVRQCLGPGAKPFHTKGFGCESRPATLWDHRRARRSRRRTPYFPAHPRGPGHPRNRRLYRTAERHASRRSRRCSPACRSSGLRQSPLRTRRRCRAAASAMPSRPIRVPTRPSGQKQSGSSQTSSAPSLFGSGSSVGNGSQSSSRTQTVFSPEAGEQEVK